MTEESLNSELLAAFATSFERDRTARIVQNAVTETPIKKVAMDRKVVTSIDPSMSVKVDRWPITNQKKSGRCWLFSGLNSFKAAVYEDTDLKDFEFSQNYLHFWDKLEKANFFLTSMIELADRDVDERTVHFLLSDPIEDGGQWNMFVSLVQKHGVVPKYAMPETESSSNTREMNLILENLLRRGARDVREAVREGGDASATKRSVMEQVHRVLSIHLGTPPPRSCGSGRTRTATSTARASSRRWSSRRSTRRISMTTCAWSTIRGRARRSTTSSRWNGSAMWWVPSPSPTSMCRCM